MHRYDVVATIFCLVSFSLPGALSADSEKRLNAYPTQLFLPTGLSTLDQPEVEGSITLSVKVSPSGAVLQVAVTEKSIKPPLLTTELIGTVLDAVGKWQYPPATRGRSFTVRFLYEGSAVPENEPLTSILFEPSGTIRIRTYTGGRFYADPLTDKPGSLIKTTPFLDKLYPPIRPPLK